MGKFYRVVLTGGPCAGKTSALAFISDHFRSLGWKVYIVQEAATIFLGGGIAPRDITPEQVPVVQKSIVRLMMCLEDSYRDLVFASLKKAPPSHDNNLREILKLSHDDIGGDKGDNCLIISDRGVMDASVYCDPQVWQEVLQDLGVTEVEVKDMRYDCIVHLVTAAQGAEPFYTLASNAVRTETIDEARMIDQKTMNAWIGHPYFTVIDNSTGFKEKVVRAVSAICKRVGVPELDKSILKRKFLVRSQIVKPEELLTATSAVLVEESSGMLILHVPGIPGFKDSECEYTYVLSTDSNTQQRLRKRAMLTKGTFLPSQGCIYTHTTRSKSRLRDFGSYMEEKQNISKREYRKLLRMRLPDHEVVRIVKRSFVYEQHHFEISIWQEPSKHRGLLLLETYCDEGAAISLPDKFLHIEREVTDDPQYSMFNLSQRPPHLPPLPPLPYTAPSGLQAGTRMLSPSVSDEELAFESTLKADTSILPPEVIASATTPRSSD